MDKIDRVFIIKTGMLLSAFCIGVFGLLGRQILMLLAFMSLLIYVNIQS